MANTLTEVMPKLLARGLMSLREQAFVPQVVNRGYESMAGEKGSVITVPVPSAIAAQAVSPAATPPSTADIGPTSVAIALDKWYEAPFYLTDKEVLEVMEGTLPMQAGEAIKSLANQVNNDLLALYKDVYGYVGTAGTTPFGTANDTSDATNLRKTLNKQLAPMSPRVGILDPDAEAKFLGQRAGQDASWRGSTEGLVKGRLGEIMGFDWYMHQLVPTHTAGTGSGYLINNGAGYAAGIKTVTVDTGSGTILVGDIVTFAGHTQTYVVTAALASNQFSFYPGLKVAVADNVAITVKASHVVNLGFHRDAFAFATRPLAGTVDAGLNALIRSAIDPNSGLSLRLEVTREHKRTRYSFDILYGVKTVQPELACRLAG